MSSQLDQSQIIQSAYDESTQSLRVGVISGSDSQLNVVDFLDTPVTSATTINGSAGAFTQVVASLADHVEAVHLIDTSGKFLGLYTGAVSSETLKLVINPGSDSIVPIQIAAGARVSVRSMETTAPTGGYLSINFLG